MISSIVFAALTFLMTRLFPLTEIQILEVRRRLDERWLAKLLPGESTDEVAEKRVRETRA